MGTAMSSTPHRPRNTAHLWVIIPAVAALVLTAVLLIVRAATSGLSSLDVLLAAIVIAAIGLTLAVVSLTWAVRGLIRERHAERVER